jgi:hypothetical protein
MKRLVVAAIVLVFAAPALVRADDKASPTGTWKWTIKTKDGQEREFTLKLKADGDKLTGAMIRGDQETKIDEGTIKGDEVSFTITRERNGQKVTTKYSGKVIGDTIKGKAEFERDGKQQSRDWEAKRAKE